MNQAKCTTCGAGLTIKKGDKTCVCEYCQSTNIVENALALGKVEVDVTEDIKKLRSNLTTFVQQNSIDEIIRVSQKLLDWIPQDFVALYFFGYAKQQQNQPRFLYDFFSKAPPHTSEEIKIVLEHMMRYSELRDKARILSFLETYASKLIKQYEKIHREREDQEDHYANIPRDIFVCFSSFDVDVAKSVVQALEADGNTCWISTRNLRPEDAENYWKNIGNAIQNSSIFLVVSSVDSMRSKDVHQELELAQKFNKRLIEFKIDDASHNTLFKHVFDGNKWVKGTKETKQSFKGLLQRVYEEKSLPIDSLEPLQSKLIGKHPNKILIGSLISVFVVTLIAFFIFNNNGIDITLNGTPSIIISAGDRYNEFGAQAFTSRNELLPVEIIGSVDVMKPGIYTIVYRAIDDRGTVVETERIVQVIDTTPPELQMLGSDNKLLLLGDEFTDPGVTAIDNVDGTVNVTARGQVDTSIAGTYQIEYNAIDQAGNRSLTLIRNVLVRIPTIDDLIARAFTVITIDINPTIAIFLDSTDRVFGVLPLNEDAEDVLTGYSYVNQNVDQVIEAIIFRSENYLNDNEVILIGVQSTSESKQTTIATRVERRVEQVSQSRPQNIETVVRMMDLNPLELRPVLRQEVPTQARQDFVQELIEVGRVNENANAIINRPIREIEAQRVEARVDEILNDTVPPQIRLQGNPNQNISLNGTYIEFGATVDDNMEDDLQVVITGTVDTTRAGVYELVYTAKDSAGNDAAPVTRRVTVGSVSASTPSTGGGSSGSVTPPSSGGSSGSVTPPTTPGGSQVTTPPSSSASGSNNSSNETVVDNEKPLINLIGPSDITLEVGSNYVEQGATVTDNVDSGLIANITGIVNTGLLGTYTINYSASDKAGNQSSVTRTIRVVDTTKPTITLNGSPNITLEQGQSYNEQGATVKDNYDQNLQVQITSVINTNVVGTYTIKYNATDSSGNQATPVSRTILVEAREELDTIPPVITPNGSSSINHQVKTLFTDPGATANDNRDGNVNVSVIGSVNINLLGTYTITYRSSDQAGNTAEVIRIVNIVDTIPPVITLNGPSTVTIEVGSVYNELGVVVTDNFSTNLTATITGTVNRNILGTYTLTYNAKDGSGNNATPKTRTVRVVDTTPPVISLNGGSTIYILRDRSFSDPGVTITDNYSQNIQANITGSVNSNVVGNYNLTYSASDSSRNNAITVSRSVIVIDDMFGLDNPGYRPTSYITNNGSKLYIVYNSQANPGISDVYQIDLYGPMLDKVNMKLTRVLEAPYGNTGNNAIYSMASNSNQLFFFASQSSNSHYFRYYNFEGENPDLSNMVFNRVALPLKIISNDRFMAATYKTSHPSALQRDISLIVKRTSTLISEFSSPILSTNSTPFAENYNTFFGQDLALNNNLLYVTMSPTGSQSGPGSVVSINLLSSTLQFERIYSPHGNQETSLNMNRSLNFGSSVASENNHVFIGAPGAMYSVGNSSFQNGSIYVYEFNPSTNQHIYKFRIRGPEQGSNLSIGHQIYVKDNTLMTRLNDGTWAQYEINENYNGYEFVKIHQETFIGKLESILIFYDNYNEMIKLKQTSE